MMTIAGDRAQSAIAFEPITGRCYCGHMQLTAGEAPSVIAYCHCVDCRRLTGAPVAAFAAFPKDAVVFTPTLSAKSTMNEGVERYFCPRCGSPLAGTFSHLPDKIYVPIGLLDQADQYPPTVHSHDLARLSWLHIDDDALRFEASARSRI